MKLTPKSGFALIELLLVVVLLLLFSGAAVMNLAPLWKGARLDEGVGQLEALLRFVRAEAAQQGRRLQLHVQGQPFNGDERSDASPAALTAIHVRWEPEPLAQPGVFIESESTAALARSVAEHVRVEHVRRLDASPAPTSPDGDADTEATAEAGFDSGAAATTDGSSVEWPPIMFYPDGSSDSAEIVVSSIDVEDTRRLRLKWNGLSGTTAREALDPGRLNALAAGSTEAQPLEPASVARTALRDPAP